MLLLPITAPVVPVASRMMLHVDRPLILVPLARLSVLPPLFAYVPPTSAELAAVIEAACPADT